MLPFLFAVRGTASEALVSERIVLFIFLAAGKYLARSSTSNRQGTVAAKGAFAELSSMYSHVDRKPRPISTPPLAFSLRNTGEYPALSDPVIMIGTIPLWG